MPESADGKPAYRRILVKLSGEALMGDSDYGIDPAFLKRLASEIAAVRELGVEVAVVIGGGNLFRGAGLAWAGMDRVTADQMGMLATVMNSLALQDALEKCEVPTRVQTAIEIRSIAEPYIRRRAIRHFEKGRFVIFAAGTGNPYFSTDTAAALRAMEIKAQALFKATKVDGIYDRDPVKFPDAKMVPQMTFDRFINERIGVMDSTAATLCRDNNMPIRVFKLTQPGNLMKVLRGENIGTVVEG